MQESSLETATISTGRKITQCSLIAYCTSFSYIFMVGINLCNKIQQQMFVCIFLKKNISKTNDSKIIRYFCEWRDPLFTRTPGDNVSAGSCKMLLYYHTTVFSSILLY